MTAHFIELFLIGITFSFGPCFLFCGPAALAFIAATKRNAAEGLLAAILFSISRMVVYILLGFLAGGLGRVFLDSLSSFRKPIFSAGGFLIAVSGIIIMIGRYQQMGFCRIFDKKILERKILGPILFGLIIGILPCLPLSGVLAYIALIAGGAKEGALLGLSFGLGGIVSPIILFGAFSGALAQWVARKPAIYEYFRIACGFILFVIGVRLIFY